MLYSTLLVAATAFSSFAVAQNGTAPPGIGACCNVDSGQVPSNQKSEWCRAEQNTCPEICGGQGQIASGGNDCDSDTLKFTCKCKNGTQPDMTKFQQSVPGQMCRFWFDQCINATGSDVSQQFFCTSTRDSQCGNETTKAAASSGASSASTASATGGSSRPSASATGATASQSSGAAMALAREYGTPMLAGGMITLFGFAL